MDNFELIDRVSRLGDICAQLFKHDVIALDVETTGLDPYLSELRLVQLSDGQSTYVLDLLPFNKAGTTRTATELQPLRDLLAGPNTKVAHNMKFDFMFIKHHLGVEVESPFCTMLASQVLSCGKQDRQHSLAAVAEYFLGITVDKTQQASDWSQEHLDLAQLEYAAKDATILISLYEEQLKRLGELNLLEVMRLENDCLASISDMELTGIYLDAPTWRTHLATVEATRARLDDELQRDLVDPNGWLSLFGKADVNLGSPAQVRDALVALGIPVPVSLEAWKIEPMVVDYPIIGKYLDYKAVDKVLTSFGENILDMIHPITGRLHPSVRQLGAITTGRFSMSEPNFQQWPADEVSRGAVQAAPGKKLVIADYSQIELRILAHRSQDPVFISAFKSGADFHQQTAAEVYGVPLDQVTDEQRYFSKRLNFGIVYGVGPNKFGMMTNTTTDVAEQTMRNYFEKLPGLARYLRDEGRSAICARESRTASGRLLHLHFDENAKWDVAAAKRNGVNQPIQGTSADILKRALALLHKSMKGTSGHLVNIVHDEVLVECDAHEADTIAEKLTTSMIQAGEEYVKTVPISVDPVISNEWRKK